MKRLLDDKQREQLKRDFPFYSNVELAKKYGTSVGCIKRFGDKYIVKKSKEYLSMIRTMAQNRDKQYDMETNLPIEEVSCIMQWSRKFTTAGETRKAQFKSSKKCHTVSVMLSRWNYEEGRDAGLWLHAKYDMPNAQVTITAVKWEDKDAAKY